MIKNIKQKNFFNPMGQHITYFYIISTFCWSESFKKKQNYVVPLDLCKICMHCDFQEFFQKKCKEVDKK